MPPVSSPPWTTACADWVNHVNGLKYLNEGIPSTLSPLATLFYLTSTVTLLILPVKALSPCL